MVKSEESKVKPEMAGSAEKKKVNFSGSHGRFDGKCEGLKGFIFNTIPKNADQFTIVQEEMARYVDANFKNGDLVSTAV
eukprot:2490553-Ditylum_brightwellii.AAC.1